MAKKGMCFPHGPFYHSPSSCLLSPRPVPAGDLKPETLTWVSSQIAHDRRAPPQHGHDRLLSNHGAATHLAAPQHVEVRPGRQEAGAVLGAEAREELIPGPAISGRQTEFKPTSSA
jgi:hypothetical protein